MFSSIFGAFIRLHRAELLYYSVAVEERKQPKLMGQMQAIFTVKATSKWDGSSQMAGKRTA